MDGLVRELRNVVGEAGCLVRPEELAVYQCDGLTCHRADPVAVVFPRSRVEVQRVIRACRAAGTPFVPRGAGTGLSGGALAEGAVVIECSRMKRILEIDTANRTARVEPGIPNAEVSKAVAPHGLHYAPDPSSQLVCTIGGNVAENSGGPHTLKYGTTTNHVLALELVLPDGECVELGSPTGWASGYDLVGAVVGSEGTLGVVTAATVRLVPLPEGVETLLGIFPDVVSACRAVGGIIEAGMVPAALEIVDQRTIAAVEASVYAAGLPTDAGAVLLVELDGAAVALAAQVERVRAIAAGAGATAVEVARDEAERQRFWRARKGAFGAMGRLAPDLYVHDAVVPRSRLPEVLERICAIGDRYGLKLSNVFHAGDGNLHPNISFDRRDPDELRRVFAAGAEILELCVAAGGVITGEHGIGNEKRDFMRLVFGDDDLDAMHRLRDVFDPDHLCNPGKVLPTPRFCVEANPKARGYDRVGFE
ncbi:MAG: FAD-binding protein [Myxococcales bacterium]|nr:FAD-binding protein [Myxococcales bacterium]MDH5305784.1 FAD-binding protein [Myxococcales bacterium]MDH5566211.1 FAD-binding protein [Myxococcales bacterium]